MATTKRTVAIMNALATGATEASVGTAITVTGGDAGLDLATLGVASVDGTTGLPTANFSSDIYAAATQQTHTVTTTGASADADLYITLIDVTGGREKFPRRTFTADTAAALATAINTAHIMAGDGFELAASVNGDVVTVTSAANQTLRVAATDGCVIAETQVPVFQTGFTKAQAAEAINDLITHQYGRTNRVKFPIVEPNVITQLSEANYDLLIFTKVSEVKFDKNQGNSYQDIETFYVFADATIDYATTALVD